MPTRLRHAALSRKIPRNPTRPSKTARTTPARPGPRRTQKGSATKGVRSTLARARRLVRLASSAIHHHGDSGAVRLFDRHQITRPAFLDDRSRVIGHVLTVAVSSRYASHKDAKVFSGMRNHRPQSLTSTACSVTYQSTSIDRSVTGRYDFSGQIRSLLPRFHRQTGEVRARDRSSAHRS